MNSPEPVIYRWRHWHALVTAFAALVLISLGGLVTSHGVGMAVPDWPNSYGYNMFFFPVSQWVGGIFYEHTHRLAGTVVGFLTLVLTLGLHGRAARPWLRAGSGVLLLGGLTWAVFTSGRKDWAFLACATGTVGLLVSWFWPRGEPASAALRWLGNLALVLVIAQGVLGGLRVVLMQDAIGILHATLAQLFLGLIGVVALLTSPWWWRWRVDPSQPLSRLGPVRGLIVGTSLLILMQLVIGASMRHRHAGLAIPDFPLAHGRLWPSTTPEAIARYNRDRPEARALNAVSATDVQLHMVHRMTGVGVMVLLVVTAVGARRRLGAGHVLTRCTGLWAGLGVLQLLLGALTVWTNKSADIATAHVTVGSLLLLGGACLSLMACRRGVWAARPMVQELSMLSAPLASSARPTS